MLNSNQRKTYVACFFESVFRVVIWLHASSGENLSSKKYYCSSLFTVCSKVELIPLCSRMVRTSELFWIVFDSPSNERNWKILDFDQT